MIRALDRATAFRLGRTFGAQAYGQAVTIVVQVALVPLLLRAWGAEIYGAWLMLSAIPFYLTFSDFGFTFVAKNEMVMAVAAGRRAAALAVFHSIFAMLCVALPALMLATIGVVAVVPLSFAGIGAGTARGALILLVANVLLYQPFLLVCAGIRAENRPASEALWAASARLGEGAAIALAALAEGGVVAAAAAMVASRLLALVAGYGWLRRRSAWLYLGFRAADRRELRRLSGPALSYMAMPAAQALLIQGPVLIVGGMLGAVSVVLFSTSRTLARLGTAGANMINNSVVSEYSALAGAGDGAGFARLARLQLGVTALITLFYGAAVLAVAPILLPVLTHGAVPVVWPFFAIVVAGVAAEMAWSALFTPIAAVNRHRSVALRFLMLAGAALAACWPLTYWFGVNGAAYAVLGAHLTMAVLCLVMRRG